MLIFGLFVGLLLGLLNLHRQLDYQYSAHESNNDFRVLGTVSSVPKKDGRRSSFLFNIETFIDGSMGAATTNRNSGHSNSNSNSSNGQSSRQPSTIRLSWYGYAGQSVRAGDRWQLTVRLKPPSSLGNPGGFNYERWLFQHRVHATGYVRDKPAAIRVGRQRFSLHAIREAIALHITGLPNANEFAPLVQGLTVGITNNISEQQ